jgi:glycerophosphoryl diester phosphodiesterase
MTRAGSQIILRGPYKNGSAGGIDTPAQFEDLPDGFSGLLWTDNIQTIAPLVKSE